MYRYITIERQFCSGGQQVASMLAKKLGYKLCDHGILVETARRLELPAIYISDLEETAKDNPLYNLAQTALGGLSKKRTIPLSEQIFEAEKQVILDEAADSNCVFVGRCAGKILENNQEKCLRVFIYADMSFRMERAEKVENISSDKVISELKRMDKKRADFFNAHSGSKWGSLDFFPICLNYSILGVYTCVDMLLNAVGK